MNSFKRIIIFSGTTEGRELSTRLSELEICHTVCVATEYGEMMQPENTWTAVLEGRLDAAAMRALFEADTVVVDATHPFAFEVTANLKEAAAEKSSRYLRVLRETKQDENTTDGCRYFDSMLSCAEAINNVSGNVLFTTGSKELARICSVIDDRDRLFARVLPSVESITLCEKAGIRNNHIIALHGPFTEELNAAIIGQYDISCLVTRDSGRAGGFTEKLNAARSKGAECFVIRRPVENEGISPEAAYEILRELPPIPDLGKARILRLAIIGAGMGTADGMTLSAAAALKDSDVVFGAKRLIAELPNKEKHPFYLARDILPALESELERRTVLNAAVVFSGDISFYSGASKFETELRHWAAGQKGLSLNVSRFPGISSASYMAAILGVNSSDTLLLSLHGRNSVENVRNAAEKIAESGSAFVLLSSGDDLSALAKQLSVLQVNAEFDLGSRLSYPDESITHLCMQEALGFGGRGLYSLYVRINKND